MKNNFNINNNWPCKKGSILGSTMIGFECDVYTSEQTSIRSFRFWYRCWILNRYYQCSNKNTTPTFDINNRPSKIKDINFQHIVKL